MDEPLKAELFIPHVGKVLRVRGGRHALTLTDVELHPRQEAQATLMSRQPFTLILAGPPGDVLREGFYSLEIDDGPTFELYVMPIQTFAAGRQEYQVAVN
jgi:hypothetical protein